MAFTTESGDPVRLGPAIAKGAQGEVFDLTAPAGGVLKRYHDRVLTGDPSLRDRIRAMVADPPAGWREPRSGHVVLSWPTSAVSLDGRFVGFTMPRLDTSQSVELHEIANPSSRTAATGSASWTRGFTWRYLVAAAANLAAATAELHAANVVIGDFNERNVLIWHDARITIVDCDSMQIRDRATGRHFLCGVGRPDFTAPELLHADWRTTVRLPSSDLTALAIHLHQLLLDGSHPFDGLWHGGGDKPKRQELAADGVWVYAGNRRLSPRPTAIDIALLPAEIRDLFRRAFVDGASNPSARPQAQEWREALNGLQRRLKECGVNKAHVYQQSLRECPWCRRSLRSNQGSLPPLAPVSSVPAPPSVPGFTVVNKRGGGTPLATPLLTPPATTVPIGKPTAVAGKAARRSPWSLGSALAQTAKVFLGVIVVASTLGTPWGESTFDHLTPHPYQSAIKFLFTVALVTGVPALAVALSFDIASYARGRPRAATLRWPGWQKTAVAAAAIVPPVAYFGIHWGQKFSEYSSSQSGPPKLFWWLAPLTMAAANSLCLGIRWLTES